MSLAIGSPPIGAELVSGMIRVSKHTRPNYNAGVPALFADSVRIGDLEQRRQCDASVLDLRITAGYARVEIRGRVVGREQHERLQEREYLPLTELAERGEGIACILRFATVTHDHFLEV